jgi:hypothetical protein
MLTHVAGVSSASGGGVTELILGRGGFLRTPSSTSPGTRCLLRCRSWGFAVLFQQPLPLSHRGGTPSTLQGWTMTALASWMTQMGLLDPLGASCRSHFSDWVVMWAAQVVLVASTARSLDPVFLDQAVSKRAERRGVVVYTQKSLCECRHPQRTLQSINSLALSSVT